MISVNWGLGFVQFLKIPKPQFSTVEHVIIIFH
jgi:hypothetical protein